EGEVSGLVETPYGLHIIKVDKIFPGQTLPLDKVKDQIKNQFMDQKLKVEYQRYLSELKQNAFIENKMSPPPQAMVNNSNNTVSVETLNPSPGRGDALADIPASQHKKDPIRPLTQEQEFNRFQTFEEKLRYYKQLRNNNKISEGEYQNKKRELLSQF
ncbi:MAG: peptidyl-prolyl cis-trans isomerase, partial [Nitrospinota bacterium]|nr:peptidyl-prolyl cis-trans isomerase [Nitrospinota bacterium]